MHATPPGTRGYRGWLNVNALGRALISRPRLGKLESAKRAVGGSAGHAGYASERNDADALWRPEQC